MILLFPFYLFIYLLIIFIDGFPAIYKQKRSGQNGSFFLLYKYRTMKKNSGDIPTHIVNNPASLITNTGFFLRRFSLDELPQLLNIIKGDMVFIGPRPALHNQYDLINYRNKKKIFTSKPGITGWAQVNGRDKLSIKQKVDLEEYYMNNKSFKLDCKIILLTIRQLIFPSNISH